MTRQERKDFYKAKRQRRILKVLAKRYHWALQTGATVPTGLSTAGLAVRLDTSSKASLDPHLKELVEEGKLMLWGDACPWTKARLYTIPKEASR